eukprot:11217538-Lingulodinium_polyedra.AAC.1
MPRRGSTRTAWFPGRPSRGPELRRDHFPTFVPPPSKQRLKRRGLLTFMVRPPVMNTEAADVEQACAQ